MESRVTIALGIIVEDGIVLAADTEESSGYLKSGQTKIVGVLDTEAGRKSLGACLISGAGTSDYIDSLTYELADVFFYHPNLAGKDLKSEFGKCVKSFYRDHIIPFAPFPEDERPDVRMLIAAYRGHDAQLLFTNRSTITQSAQYKAIGAGSVFAKILLDRLFKSTKAVETQILAAYIVFMAKECVEGCGKFTTVATLHRSTVVQEETGTRLVAPSPSFSYLPWSVIGQLEDMFRKQWAWAEKEMIWNLISSGVASFKQPDKN
jgi:hypothetical protein